MNEGAQVVVTSGILVYPNPSFWSPSLRWLHVSSLQTHNTWIIIIVGVILVYKDLTTSVVPYVPTTISRMVAYRFYTMYVAFCILIQNWDSIGNQSYMSESSDPHGHVITTSINRRDRWFWTANDISYRKEIPPLENSWVSAWTLVLQYLLFVSPPRCSQFCFQKKTGVGIAYEYLPIIEQDHFYLDYTLCLSSVRVLITLCHGHGLWIWIICKVLQSSWEMYVDNCRLPVIWFSRIYISIYSWWKYRYP